MKDGFLDALYMEMHPALSELRLLYWYELKESSPDSPLWLYGDELSCELFRQRFAEYSIPISGLISWPCHHGASPPKNAVVIITLRDYPRDTDLYFEVRHRLRDYGIETPYVIHEFCSGFALGADRLLPERAAVERAYSILSDSVSRECYLSFIQRTALPYHWNMDIKAGNFGIPDPRRPSEMPMAYGHFLPDLSGDGYVFFCNTTGFQRNDPRLEILHQHRKSVLFYPVPLSRLRLREYLDATHFDDSIPVIDSALWSRDGSFSITIEGHAGGAPLSYGVKAQTISATSVDGVILKNHGCQLEALILDMEEDYSQAIYGAANTIQRDHPVIVVNGFSRADRLWRAIIWLNERLPTYRLSLHRYHAENILQGHSIILE